MGLEAQLIAIGRFHPQIKDYLDYPGSFYKNTKEETPVITRIYQSVTTYNSQGLADALGVDPWDFNQHYLKAGQVLQDDVLSDIYSVVEEAQGPNEATRIMNTIKALGEHKFAFMFLPDG